MTRVSDDDEAEIEAQIRRELEALGNDSLDLQDLEQGASLTSTEQNDADVMPDSLTEYLRLVQSRREGAEEGVRECDSILDTLSAVNDEEQLAKKIREKLLEECDDPLALRDKVLLEIEEEELKEEEQKSDNKQGTEEMAIDIIRPELAEDIKALEDQALEKMRELEEKQALREKQRNSLYEEIKKVEEERRREADEARKQRQVELESAQQTLLVENQVKQEELESELQQNEQLINRMEEEFQEELKKLEQEKEEQNQALLEMQAREAEYQREKQQQAAIKLQKHYKGYRARVQFKPILEEKRRERQRKRKEELDRIERVERKIREEQERKKREEQEEKEKRRRELEQNAKAEEKWRMEEEERRRREEEEEKKRKEEEDRKKKEETRRKEEEERKKKEYEERRAEEERQRKAEERERREEERRKKEEAEKREAEEKRKREERERERREEEKRRKEETERREAEEERRRKEEEEREEEKNRKLEEERRLEKEKREKEQEQKRKEEEEKRKAIEEQENRMKEEDWTRRKAELDKKLKGEDDRIAKAALDQIPAGSGLSRDVEERRKLWAAEHTAWSTSTKDNRTQPVARSKPRRAFSASKHLPILTEEQLLQASPSRTPLRKVPVVHLESVPGCTMQGFHRCPSVRSVTLQNCGLLAVEGLDQCPQLQELRVQDNKIEVLNCRDLGELQELAVYSNNLSSVQGLEGCAELRSLDLQNNKITRIGDLSSCSKLQNLYLDHNQLIMTKGLCNLPRLQHLSCSHNHLPHVKEIDQCALLHSLDLRANNLQQPPPLTNHVVLRELRLDDNSISSLAPLARAWLPLLQLLSVSQNSVSVVDSLEGLVMLETLDLSHNLISDTESLFPGIVGCKRLQTLQIEGNPVHVDPNCRVHIVAKLPWLTELDCVSVRNEGLRRDDGSFVRLCCQQISQQNAMKSRHEKEMENTDILTRLKIKARQHEERFQLAVNQFREHETYTPEGYPQVDQQRTHLTSEKRKKTDAGDGGGVSDESLKHVAVTRIQALWRGWHLRHRIEVQTRRWLAAVTIQSAWRGHWVRASVRGSRASWEGRHHAAATSIQACYRGYRVRRRLCDALKFAQYDDSDGADEFDYDEEVDLTAFDFDARHLDEGWTPSDTPQLPSRGPVLSSSHIQKPKNTDTPSEAPWRTRQAWRSIDSPVTNIRAATRPTPEPADVSVATVDHDQMSVTSGTFSHMSRKAEELSNEWGFKNADTAERMMQRARKMKYNPARRKKLMDPNKRLALFKKLEEANKLRDVKPPARKQPANRVEYFAAREAMSLPSGASTPTNEKEAKAEMTYSWVYKQAVIHQDEEENLMPDRREYAESKARKVSPQKYLNKSPVNLPPISPIALSGRNVPLVSSPMFHSASEKGDTSNQSARRHSLSSDSVRFPPLKTHSVPNLTVRSRDGGESAPGKSNSAGARMSKEQRAKRR